MIGSALDQYGVITCRGNAHAFLMKDARVERPVDLPAALMRAAERVRGGQQAVVNVVCRG